MVGGARPRRDRGLGRAAARASRPGRPVGRRGVRAGRLHPRGVAGGGPALDGHPLRAEPAPRARPRPRLGERPGHGGAGRRRTPAGTRAASRSGRARSRSASTAAPSPTAPSSASTSGRSSSACSASGSRTAAGTASGPTARRGRRSTRRSTWSRGCWSTSARPAARRRCAPRGDPARRSCWNARSSAGSRPASRPTRISCCSGTRTAGATTSCAGSTISAPRRSSDGEPPDPRLGEAIAELRRRRLPDGRWPLDRTPRGRVWFAVDEPVGQPSRWVTLRALRVLEWWDSARAG